MHPAAAAPLELWTMRIPEIGTVVAQAERAERARLGRHHVHRLAEPRRRPVRRGRARGRARPSGSGSRPASPTRSPAIPPRSPTSRRRCRRRRAVASCSASAGATPRCSTSGASRCRSPRSSSAVTDLQTYLANGTIDCDGRPSRLRWLDRCRAAEGPARHRGVGPADDRVRGAASPSASRSRSAPIPIGSRGRSTSPARPRPTPGAIPPRSRSART